MSMSGSKQLRSVFARDVGEGVEDVLRAERQRQPRARVARRHARLQPHTAATHTLASI